MKLFSKKNLFILFLLLVLALIVLNFQLKEQVSTISIMKTSDQLSVMLRSEIDKGKENALRNALFLAHNDSLISAMENNDEEQGYIILSSLMDSVKKHTHTPIPAQIITDDYLIFARSWDNTFAGMPIDEYRPDLQYFLKNKNPRSAIEVGRRLGIKATVPIYRNEKRFGFVEVLEFFESTTEYFRNMGVELYILMDARFYGIAIFMQENPFIGKDYIVANRHYNAEHLPDLEQIDFDTLRQQNVLAHNKKYFFYEPMTDGTGEDIGAFVMVMPERRLKLFTSKEDELSFMINFTRSELYEITRKQYGDISGYKSHYDKELLYLKDVVAPEDKALFLEEARDRLAEYSREELIGMILNYDIPRQVNGEIQ